MTLPVSRNLIAITMFVATLTGNRAAIAQNEEAQKKPAVHAVGEEKPASPSPSIAPRKPVRELTATLRLVTDPQFNWALQHVLASEAFDRSLINEAIKIASPDGVKVGAEAADITGSKGSIQELAPGIALLTVTVQSFDDRIAVDQVLLAYTDRLSHKLQELDAQNESDDHQKRLLEDQAARFVDRLKAEKEALINLAAIHEMSATPEINIQRKSRLESELEAVAVEIVGLEARKKALEEQIARLGANADADVKDPVIGELEKAVDLRAKTLARLRTLRGADSVPEASVRDGELALIAARAELAKYRREASQLGSQRMAELRRRLDDTAIDLAESAAKKEVLEHLQLKARQFSSDLEIKHLRIAQIERDYEAISADLTAITAKLRRYVPPTVTIVSKHYGDVDRKRSEAGR